MQSHTETSESFIQDSNSTDTNQLYNDSETHTELLLDDEMIEPQSATTSFQPETTPVMGKLAAAIPAALTGNLTTSDWSLEKTILVDDDESLTASLFRTDTNEVVELNEFPFVIGRSNDCQLQLADPSLSRHHATINKSESGMTIEDEGSANGIKVNNIRVKQVLLMDGDTITLGHVNLRFDLTGKTQNHSRPFAFANDWQDRFHLSQPNWKLLAGAGIGVLLLASWFYKSNIDDRVMVTQQPIAVKATQQSKTDKQSTSNQATQQPKVSDKHITVATAQPDTVTSPQTAQTQVTEKNTVTAPSDIAALIKPVSKPVTDQSKSETVVADNTSLSDKQTIDRSAPISVVTSPKAKSKPVKPVTKARKKAKPRIKRPRVTLQTTMAKARRLYQDGNVSKAIKLLNKQTTRSRQPVALVAEAQDLEQLMSQLHTDYQNGRQAYDNGDQSQAWAIWKAYLKSEKTLGLTTKSTYALAIQQRVRDESLARGKALEQTDSKAAYQHWQRAARLDPNSQASSSAAALENKARDMYREGYRLETANLAKAIQRWRQVTELAPPSSEYYTKAKAKLRFYEEMNQ
jgi:tetratricopeptide (TPR) repeat protein